MINLPERGGIINSRLIDQTRNNNENIFNRENNNNNNYYYNDKTL